MRRLLLLSGAAVLGLVAFAAWQLGLFSSDPAEVSLAETVAAVAQEEAEIQAEQSSQNTESEEEPAADAAESDSNPAEDESVLENDTSEDACSLGQTFPEATGDTTVPASIGDLDGTWLVQSTEQTFVGYRIDEILSGVDFTAVGRSSGVSGAITIEAGALTETSIVANLGWLTSDSRIRDEQLKSQALQTQRFPAACFELTAPVTLSTFPADGASVDLPVDGTFTIHGVAQPHTLELQATVFEERLVVVGSTTVALADHDIDTPSAPAVAGVSDTAVIEFSLILAR